MEDQLLAEVATKKVGKRIHNRADFLVVEDPEKVGTWHLPVKMEGTPDRRLAGAAWAALFSASGYRGSKYAGPDKSKAQSKLQALYKAEDWDEPGGESGLPTDSGSGISNEVDSVLIAGSLPIASGDNGTADLAEGVYTFAGLQARDRADDAARKVHRLTYQFQDLAWNIFIAAEIEDKVAAIRELADEFVGLVEEAVSDIGEYTLPVIPDEPAEMPGASMPTAAELSETGSASIVQVTDLAEQLPDADNPPLQVDIAVIEPGWGNARDNHYYPAEMLRDHAEVFAGAKMYATDHKQDEKSVLTEVSQVLACPVGFTDSGAPIARVGIFDETFATNIRNRAKLGKLDALNVSILASGLAKPYEEGKRKGKLVEAITTVASVDWVTRAGAGGRALRLAEDDGQEGTNMEDAREEVGTDTAVEEVENVELVENPEGAGSDESTAASETAQEQATGTGEAQPTALSEADVKGVLAEANLPDVSVERLTASSYADETALESAVDAERAYVEQLTGAGRPVGQTAEDAQPKPDADAALLAEYNAIDKRYGLAV